MQIYKVKWGIYSDVGVGAMISSMLTPCIFEIEKSFFKKEDADTFSATLKAAAAVIGLGYPNTEFKVNIGIEEVFENL